LLLVAVIAAGLLGAAANRIIASFFGSAACRKHHEETLQFANALLTAQSEESPDAILVVDGGGRIVSFNRRFAKLFSVPDNLLSAGRGDEAVLALATAQMKDPDAFLARVRHFYAHPNESGNDLLETIDGHIIDRHTGPLRNGRGDYLGRIWFFRDTTERARAEESLRQERDFSAALIDSLPGIFFVLDANGCNVRYNANLATVTGRSMAELAGTSALENVAPAHHERVLERMHEKDGPLQGEIEVDVVHQGDGELRRFLISARRIPFADETGILGIGIDVTDARRAQRLLLESEERFRSIFASVNDGIIVLDAKTRAFIEVNERVCDMFGYTREEMLGLHIDELSTAVAPLDCPDANVRMAAANNGDAQTFEWSCRTKQGRHFWMEVSLRHAEIAGRDVVIATGRDVTDRKQSEAQMLYMARHDKLTGLANRSVFVQAVRAAIQRAGREAHRFAVLYLDLDHFKDINDTLGHPIGDLLLQMVATRLKNCLRENDTVSRFGGDEFAVIATIGEPADAAAVAEKLLHAVADSFTIRGNEIRTGTSIGIDVFGPDSPHAETLLSHADVALYRAKSEGRGTYRFFTDEMDVEVRERVRLDTELREAIDAQQFFMVYQPQFDIDSGRFAGVEALMRWRHPTRGIVPPRAFIPAAERNGLIVAMTSWALRSVCRQIREWLDAGIAPPVVAVNLSGLQFKAPQQLEDDVAAALGGGRVPPDTLELELTETVLMEAARAHNGVLSRLRQKGVRIALDDFGTGFSSLDYLRRFPVDRIKIAKAFIRDLQTTPSSAAVVKAALGLARELGLGVIAEGVETREQLETLRAWGCREAQGFYFAKPMSVEELTPLFRKGALESRREPLRETAPALDLAAIQALEAVE